MKLIGYIDEQGVPVITEMSEHDLRYCYAGGLALLYTCPAPKPEGYA